MCESTLKVLLCEQIEFWSEKTEWEYLHLAEELVELGYTESAAVEFLKDAHTAVNREWEGEE